MNVALRKIRVTGGSWSVALPRDWTTGHGLSPGDWLRLEYDGSCIVVLNPSRLAAFDTVTRLRSTGTPVVVARFGVVVSGHNVIAGPKARG